eukprot:TRINITY_DN7351_c0_g1_i1.p1 TRINITY_DN7351_c0_g1~~TRINITY_DN7351_c0_g1_i1.p1  ORF type:complete len:437 (+),score=145.33 TRINITY_DN7351_c0_g1_i1:819-2129(+)
MNSIMDELFGKDYTVGRNYFNTEAFEDLVYSVVWYDIPDFEQMALDILQANAENLILERFEYSAQVCSRLKEEYEEFEEFGVVNEKGKRCKVPKELQYFRLSMNNWVKYEYSKVLMGREFAWDEVKRKETEMIIASRPKRWREKVIEKEEDNEEKKENAEVEEEWIEEEVEELEDIDFDSTDGEDSSDGEGENQKEDSDRILKTREKGTAISYWIEKAKNPATRKEDYILWCSDEGRVDPPKTECTKDTSYLEKEGTWRIVMEFANTVMGLPLNYELDPQEKSPASNEDGKGLKLDFDAFTKLMRSDSSLETKTESLFWIFENCVIEKNTENLILKELDLLKPKERKQVCGMKLKKYDGYNLFHMIINSFKPSLQFITKIIDACGVSIDCKTELDGYTPLILALLNEDEKMAQFLLDEGANGHISAKDGTKPEVKS